LFYCFIILPRINDPEASGFFRSYQLDRFRCLNNPNYDRDACYQVNQSLIAVGSGGLWGRGFSNSVQKFNYLPEVWADSIFPIIAEEIGFIGSVVLILAYVFLLYQGLMIAKRAPDVYGRSLAVGISAWIFFQVFLNIAGMINLVPMTGVPLPFISAGGSSLWFLLASIGILLNIDRQSLKIIDCMKQKKKIILSGGGTGGSVTPLLAIYRKLKLKYDFLFVGTYQGLELKMVQSEGLDYTSILSGKWRRYFSWRNFWDIFKIILAFFQSLILLIRERPNMIISAGAFVAVPLSWAAWVFKNSNYYSSARC